MDIVAAFILKDMKQFSDISVCVCVHYVPLVRL
jgi:hypothetical protein